VIPGLTGTGDSLYVRNMAEAATNKGYNVAVINFRGTGNTPLFTPRLYCADTSQDILEPMQYLFDKFCKDSGRLAFGVGMSLGASVLANMIGRAKDQCFLTAACII
jgi:predicted alpha/beta-fold hydrolase